MSRLVRALPYPAAAPSSPCFSVGWLTRTRTRYGAGIKIHICTLYEYDVNVVFATWEVAEKLF